MAKLKNYRLNPDTLLYEIKDARGQGILKVAGVVIASAVLFVGYLWIGPYVLGLDLPKTALLRRQNGTWQSRMELMNSRLDQAEAVLGSLEMRDNRIYRSVFGMEEIPQEVRNAGYGGVNRYAYFDGIDRGSALKKTAVRLDVLTKKTYVQSRSFDEVEAMARQAGDMASCIPAILPVSPDAKNLRLTSSFGYRTDPISGAVKHHAGEDFACKPGNSIYATGDGVVEKVKYDFFGYGLSVIVDHGFGYKTRYAHMSRIDVVDGQRVRRGTRLGLSGSSGKSTGPHVHYEVIYKGRPVNPNGYFDAEMSAKEYADLVEQSQSGS